MISSVNKGQNPDLSFLEVCLLSVICYVNCFYSCAPSVQSRNCDHRTRVSLEDQWGKWRRDVNIFRDTLATDVGPQESHLAT